MTPEHLKVVLESAAGAQPQWYAYALLVAAAGIASGFGSWAASYLSEKGKHYATKEDIDELIEQMRRTTAATETIKAEISGDLWERQTRLKYRQSLYEKLLIPLGEVWHAQTQLIEVYKRRAEVREDHPIQDRLTEIEQDYVTRERKAEEEIRQAAAIAELILSDEAVEALNQLAEEWGKARRADNHHDFQEKVLEATKRARALLADTAKKDLLLGVSR